MSKARWEIVYKSSISVLSRHLLEPLENKSDVKTRTLLNVRKKELWKERLDCRGLSGVKRFVPSGIIDSKKLIAII
ncbi:hypothetical protein TNCV_2889491 [Trichonephila clavipes]|nr:hypothetical protein TNCV_2889491 [Trichonephila clavipes]